ncbi:MAG: hypothetical protein IPP64_05860 [Bacteroidetes bacterium]|nr:hypothetical protein [Bacteroidota bacterium]
MYILLFYVLFGLVCYWLFLFEAPVKFTAPSLTLPVALDVGRHVFQAFNKVEIIFGTLLLVLVIRSQLTMLNKLLFAFVSALLVLESVWLLPVLDQRALIIIAGGIPEKESLHSWYILFDAFKVIALITLGVNTIKQLKAA